MMALGVPPKESAGKKIRKLRVDRGLTQKGLAAMIGVSDKYISRIETGSETCSLGLLIALTNALNTSMDYLMSDSLSVNTTKNNDVKQIITTEINELNDTQLDFLLGIINKLKENEWF